jgi:hypothetical protein
MSALYIARQRNIPFAGCTCDASSSYASGIVLGVVIFGLFAIVEKSAINLLAAVEQLKV